MSTTLGVGPRGAPNLIGSQGAGMMSTRVQRVVSLFSGCGGMDLGFRGGFRFADHFYEELQFDVVWANDISEAACRTYRLNLKHPIHEGDIATSIRTLPDSADAVIGGFPCQDVSINGLRRAETGNRTVLYRYMVEAIRRTRPRVFVAENVKGLLMSHGKPFFDRILAEFSLEGYAVNYRLYLAADYGVPQMRERTFIIGVRGQRQFDHPTPTSRIITVGEILADLEYTSASKETSHVWSKAARSPDQGNRRLIANRPATTIRAEHHGNIQWHYRLERRISLREAARLQSFPDEFRFPGGMRETERQIGNAVPPVLAWHIANALRSHIDS